jgi:O-antigen/teichoic acid export membrane protein
MVLATALPLIPWGPAALRWWAGPEIAAPAALFPAFAAFWLVAALTQPLGVFLSATNALRFQLACALALAAGGLVLKLLLARTLGIAGVAWGRAGAEVIFVLLPYLLFLPRFRRLRSTGAGGLAHSG